jgi:dipeptidyl aminopeptidase/acylaminoacyl peptidase
LAAVRLGRWGIAAGVAVLTVVGSVVAVGSPAESASRNREGFRERERERDRDRQRRQTGRSYDARDTGSSQAPARFVAEFEGRIVVVSAETGRAERYLTDVKAGGGASRPAVSPDGRRVWFSRSEGGCAAHLASVPVVGGKEEKVPGSGEAGPETLPLPRPGRPQLAYARINCEKLSSALMVGDFEGLEGHGQSGLLPLAWNRAGDRLLARSATGGEIRLLEINKAGGIAANTPLEPTDTTADCRLEVFAFSPDDNNGYVAVRRCGQSGDRGRRSLVLLDKDGKLRKTVLRLSRSQDFTDRPVFDATGHSLLYATVPAVRGDNAGNDRPVTLWLWRDGESRRLERQTRFRHPAWLP